MGHWIMTFFSLVIIAEGLADEIPEPGIVKIARYLPLISYSDVKKAGCLAASSLQWELVVT